MVLILSSSFLSNVEFLKKGNEKIFDFDSSLGIRRVGEILLMSSIKSLRKSFWM
jgi:hypothetical protein